MQVARDALNSAACNFSSIIEMLRWQAVCEPDRRVYTFPGEKSKGEVHLCNRDLDHQAQKVASRLQKIVAPGEPVLLCYPSSKEYIIAFLGCLYAGVVAVPAYPPRFNRPDQRLSLIVQDAGARVVLTTTDILRTVRRRELLTPEIEGLLWQATDSPDIAAEEDWHEPLITGETLAFLQYTSGSTSRPKGVMVNHANILHNLGVIQGALRLDRNTIGVSWLPMYHDMGLIGCILQPIYTGCSGILMSPITFLQHPISWLQAISRYRGTVSPAPTFAYRLCAEKVDTEQCAELDLSCWQTALCGAEPIPLEILNRFTKRFAPYGFRAESFQPSYGLAEATLMVSGYKRSRSVMTYEVEREALEDHRLVSTDAEGKGTQVIVGCGLVAPEQKVLIVDPESFTECAPDKVGEIWVAGPSVAQGYWNQAEETSRTFNAYLSDTGEGPFLRTGDLGFLHQGNLCVTGRLKDLIIIRGHNYYPQDIELIVERSHRAVQGGAGAAFSVDVAGTEQLVVALELDRHYRNDDLKEVVRSINQAVAEQYDLRLHEVVLLKPGSLPKTSSGKVQRHMCRAKFLAQTLERVTR